MFDCRRITFGADKAPSSSLSLLCHQQTDGNFAPPARLFSAGMNTGGEEDFGGPTMRRDLILNIGLRSERRHRGLKAPPAEAGWPQVSAWRSDRKESSFDLHFLHQTGTFQRFWNAVSPRLALVTFTAPRAASGKLIEAFVARIYWEEEMNQWRTQMRLQV